MVEQRHEIPQDKPIKIENVPILRQRHLNWCGYTGLSMMLQYQGYDELTPETIFKHMNGTYDYLKETKDPSRGPSLGSFALAAQELTPLQVDLFDTAKYKKIQERRPDITPHDMLDLYVTQKKAPCMVRTIRHYVVVTGIDLENERYIYNEPLAGKERSRKKVLFDRVWKTHEPDYPGDTSYLMLSVHKGRKSA